MIQRFLFAIILLSFAMTVKAQTPQPEITGGTEAARQQLRELKKLYEDSVSNNELDRLKSLMDDDFSFVTFTDSEFDVKKQSFEQFKSEWNDTRTKMLNGGSYTVVLEPQPSFINGGFAVARGIAHHKITTGGGKTFEFPGQWTAVLEKKPDGWKVIRAHSSISAFNNPMIEDYVKGLITKVAVVTALAGIVVGMMAMLIFRKIRAKA